MTVSDQLNTALAGRYEIEKEIGRGGMATVFLARDIRHGRRVALKLLDPELGVVLGAERFLSEIRVTANLQHPNLLPLFDSGEASGLLFYVMPYVEGETLRARLDREKQLPIDEAVRIAVAIGSALDYAHRHAVIHRDLKPENILLHDGQPLIADFGIALAVSNAGGTRVTQTGLSLGTPQYMSPEQATGDRGIDGRTDIYSLGAVTYEMLCGEPPHQGSTAQAIIAKLMTEQPRPMTALRRSVPPHVDAAVSCALEKLPADRFATAKDFCDALTGARPAPTIATSARRGVDRTRGALQWVVEGAALVAAAAGGYWAATRSRVEAPAIPVVRFNIDAPEDSRFEIIANPTVSRDGAKIVYRGNGPDGVVFYLRATNDPVSRLIPGTNNAINPFFSPNGDWIGFYSNSKIMKVSLSGGSPVAVASSATSVSCTWGDGDVIVCSGPRGLRKVSANGGELTVFAALDSASGEIGHRVPHFLSDSKTIVFVAAHARGTDADNRIAFATLDGDVTRTTRQAAEAMDAPGFLTWVTADGALMASRFDVAHRRLIGDPVPMGIDVSIGTNTLAAWHLSRAGTLLYFDGSWTSDLVLVNRAGIARPIVDVKRSYRRSVYSPNGRDIALEVFDGMPSIWIYSIEAKTLLRLTPPGFSDPLWSVDGKRVYFAGPDDGNGRPLMSRASDASSSIDTVIKFPRSSIFPIDHADRRLIVDIVERGNPTRVAAFTPGDTTVTRLVPADASVRLPSMSPDGRFMAYESDENGRREIFVSSYPGPGGKRQVSTNGGTEPRWSRDGKEIFYRTTQEMIAVSVSTSPAFAMTSRRVLFRDSYLRAGTLMYDLTPDGKEFLMNRPSAEDRRLKVATNWLRELEARIPRK